MANVRITGFVNDGTTTVNKTPNTTSDSLVSNSDLVPTSNNAQDLGSSTLRWAQVHMNQAFFDDVLMVELSIPNIQLQVDTNAYTFSCPYDLTLTGVQLFLDQHGTSGNVTVTISLVGGATLNTTSITGTDTGTSATFTSNRDIGDDIRFAITATPVSNTNGLRANLLFRRR